MRTFIIRAGALVAVLLVSVACALPGAIGSGTVVSEARQVSGFNQVHLAGVGNLIITQGETEALTIEAEDNILPRIKTGVQDGRLTIGQRDEWDWTNELRPTKPITYHLTVKTLNAVDLSGAASVAASDIHTDRLTVALSGAGSARIEGLTADELGTTISGAGTFTGSGTVKHQDIHISGTGHYEAAKLEARAANVAVSGTGGATVRVSETLDVQISGVGNVKYLGTPKVINQRVSGLGGVSQAKD